MKADLDNSNETGTDQLLVDLNRILTHLDERDLQLPAIHIATAIDLMEQLDA